MSRVVAGARALLIASLLGSFACAGTAQLSERAFERDLLPQLRLRKLDVVVVAAAPEAVPGDLVMLPFSPASVDAPLGARGENIPEAWSVSTRDALAESLRKSLSAKGYEVRLHLVGPALPPIVQQPPVATSTITSTSTTGPAVNLSLVENTVPKTAATPTPAFIAPESTVSEMIARSEADAILVVRVVPIDAFALFKEGGLQLDPSDPTQRIMTTQSTASEHTGRLLLGQAFLFDGERGARLWSRQLPDFPEAGRLSAGHRMLRYGIVDEGAQSSEADRAVGSAAAFTTQMLEPFPPAQDGSPAGLVALRALDLDAERAEQAFFDEGRLLIDVGVGWGLSSSSLQPVLGFVPDDPDGLQTTGNSEGIPELGVGAIAPSGVFSGRLRGSYIAPTGLTLIVGGHFGRGPSSFERAYFRENPEKDSGDPDDRLARVKITGVTTVGALAGIGATLFLSDQFLLLPSGQLHLDVWSVTGTPAVVLPKANRIRFSMSADLDLLTRLSEQFFLRSGVGLQGGYESTGSAVGGVSVEVAAGIFL